MEKFYRGLDPVTQSVANNATDEYGKENLDTQQTLVELAINVSLLTKKFDETNIKKVNVCEDDAGNYNNNYGGTNQGRYNNSNNFGNKSSNPYIPPKGQSTEQGSSKVEAMLEKILANQSKSERTLSGLTETVGSHTTDIQKLESQIKDISREQHPPKKGGLPSDTIPNPKMGERLVKKKEDAKFKKIYDQLKQLSLNFPFLEAVKEMPGFPKDLKDLLTKKKMVQHETVSLTHTVSSIISITTVQKKGNPEAFTNLCFVGHYDFPRALCDNGASINLMPLSIYKQSSLVMPRPTTMRLQMANRFIKRPVGVVNDILVRVGEFMLLADFVILNCVVDRDIPIILGRTFLATGRALMDSEKNEIKFRVNVKKLLFRLARG
ncbi:uncharacterized protein LOC132045682 [Lycium ferocissimum]|uniref:uncharacterized protein LOC132045682 n=1 Tax=Lycium ferocissimum TaxID=112874 RepID=UPI0028166E6B|nr:uncharacterized protein LOC132045682 [Lycium ferocissimum]